MKTNLGEASMLLFHIAHEIGRIKLFSRLGQLIYRPLESITIFLDCVRNDDWGFPKWEEGYLGKEVPEEFPIYYGACYRSDRGPHFEGAQFSYVFLAQTSYGIFQAISAVGDTANRDTTRKLRASDMRKWLKDKEYRYQEGWKIQVAERRHNAWTGRTIDDDPA